MTVDYPMLAGSGSQLPERETSTATRNFQLTLDEPGLLQIRRSLAAFVDENQKYDALELCYALERTTPVLLLHTILRKRSTNQYHNGLQQTYGDHTRLLALGIDMLEKQESAWFKTRFADANDASDEDIADCLRLYIDTRLSRSAQVSLWVSGCLHDYGKIYRSDSILDAEDALFLARPIINILLDEPYRSLTEFGILNHDLVEHIVTGETPVRHFVEQLSDIPSDCRHLAMPMLAIIQLAGAASLGNGRLTRRKVDLYKHCMSGSVLDETSRDARLSRLLYGEQLFARNTTQNSTLHALSTAKDRETLTAFLDNVSLVNWMETRSILVSAIDDADKRISSQLRLLNELARAWHTRFQHCSYVTIDSEPGTTVLDDVQSDSLLVKAETIQLLSGRSAALFRLT